MSVLVKGTRAAGLYRGFNAIHSVFHPDASVERTSLLPGRPDSGACSVFVNIGLTLLGGDSEWLPGLWLPARIIRLSITRPAYRNTRPVDRK